MFHIFRKNNILGIKMLDRTTSNNKVYNVTILKLGIWSLLKHKPKIQFVSRCDFFVEKNIKAFKIFVARNLKNITISTHR